jgi:hypothetical protein
VIVAADSRHPLAAGSAPVPPAAGLTLAPRTGGSAGDPADRLGPGVARVTQREDVVAGQADDLLGQRQDTGDPGMTFWLSEAEAALAEVAARS